MRSYQLELDFTSPEEKLEQQRRTEAALSTMTDLDSEWYRINKYADWWCDRVPRCLGYGLHDSYLSLRRWCISTYQKWRYGVSDEECWNLNTTFARYILPRLKHFRSMNRMGVPGNMFVKYHSIDEAETEEGVKRWNAILDEMIWTFEYIVNDETFNAIPDTKPFRSKNVEDWADSIGREKCPEEQALWDAYFAKSQTLEDRKNKGLELFAKYFDNLWD